MSTTTNSQELPLLFQPIRVGDLELKHRVVLAPLTRNRANKQHVHGDLAAQYYAQRASDPGTLLITESVTIAPEAGGRPNVPGIWSKEQIDGWRKVTDAVHEKGSFIFAQLRAYGRSANPEELRKEDPSFDYISASDVPLPDGPNPRPLTLEEVHKYIALYTQAARNAVEAGFDGVELHGANGYLIDQFISSVTNKRTDDYGGSIEARCKFMLDIMDSVTAAIGQKRTAIRLSPWSTFQDMRMDDPKPTFSYLLSGFVKRVPELAYVHLVEPGIKGIVSVGCASHESNDFIREIWSPRPIISAGAYTRDTAIQTAETKGDLIAFGRPFIGNPDLPLRLRHNYSLVKADHSVYYAYEDPKGYIDFPPYSSDQ